MKFTDIHCHILPAIDDGASDVAVALAMARQAVDDGTQTVIATPHQLGSNRCVTSTAIRTAVAELTRCLEQAGIGLEVIPGADVRIEPELPMLVRNGEVVTLADRGLHVLLELPHDVYIPLDPLLRSLRKEGLVGILSHPERNRGILAAPDLIDSLVVQGCLMQITAGSLFGKFGSSAQRLAAACVRKRLVHFVASDAHDTERRPCGLSEAFVAVRDLSDEVMAVAVCCDNPAAVAAGDRVDANPRQRPKRSFFRARSS